MGSIQHRRHQDSTVLLFGPQALSFNSQFDKLRHSLSGDAGQHWIFDTVAQLPQFWDLLTETIPDIKEAIDGRKHLSNLDSWLRKAGVENADLEEQEYLPNMILTPLVVLTQLSQYWRYLELNHQLHGDGAESDLQADLLARQGDDGTNQVQTLGFCTGLLSAFAVASAKNHDEFKKYGAVAVRLAMLIGALVDAQEVWNSEQGHGMSASYATAWRNPQQGQQLQIIIDGLSPNAYTSVIYDEARATITTSQRTAPSFLGAVKDAGITAAQVGLRGHFHSPSESFLGLTNTLIELCEATPTLRFPNASNLALPTYTNSATSGEPIQSDAGSLTAIALRAILVQQSKWYDTFAAVQGSRASQDAIYVSFGPDRFVPPTLLRRLGPRLMQFADLDEEVPQHLPSVLDPEAHSIHQQQSQHFHGGKDAIAVVGMSIKVAGADDVDEFSQMLRTGQSQHEEITSERLMMDTLFREGDKDPKRKWYGNFIRDVDAFDHKFFKRSPRESLTMDPQQRLFLQASYQAVEQSGYFTETTSSSSGHDKKHVGVYLGACAGDYEHHAACHTANAFTATGNLKSFIPGKVSHYFGWTGPSMTFDTACSASAVAIHTACQNLLSGDCTAALAGGVSTITNFLWFQNLAGASFLSPTGQCKPFDQAADGYCRAEGIACVFLKKMSDAIADGNRILGCIPSTAVYQNQNCTPLFVPNAPSLSQLFTDVIKKANLNPRDVSVVEAHGTGTPVGDPAEYESVLKALGGTQVRSKPLVLGSVKGHVGHSEGASGVISLIKIIMMMQEGYIPPQASFSQMSSYVKTSPTDMMEVSTSLRSWDEAYKVALINNYGASGSNASIIVTQSPHSSAGLASSFIRSQELSNTSFPFWISGFDTRSINAYASKLVPYVKAREKSGLSLADWTFNINRQSNRSLAQGLIFSCRSVSELEEKLSKTDASVIAVKPERPVVLCFGGQVSTFVGLDRKLYESVALLRHYLDQCDTAMQSLGLGSLYPDIFSRSPVSDAVKLQTMLFAMQYACAKCWIDSGLEGRIASVVGHSFGEITALCVSGALSFRDTIKLVAGRAKVIRDAWGPDPGAMMAVEADEETVSKLLDQANEKYGGEFPASIACYNGPRSFTLAGSSQAIDIVAEIIPQFGSLRSKRLNVTNSFHSSLVEPLMERLEELGKTVTFCDPVIPLERATQTRVPVGSQITSSFAAEHMRKPVYFNHAVRRIAAEHPSAIWLEAGSASTITIMASRALAGEVKPDAHHFQALSLTNTEKGVDGLTDATISLWKQGLPINFWAHHSRQTAEYATLLLPPYQFDKVKHWMELKSPLKAVADAAATLAATTKPSVSQGNLPVDEKYLGLWSFLGYEQRDGKQIPRFRINTGSDKYKSFISGHLIAQTAPICPATLQVDMAIEALFSIHPDWASLAMQPIVLDMANHSPLCVDPTRSVFLEFDSLDADDLLWGWKIFSVSGGGNQELHVEAKLHIRSPDDAGYQSEFGRFERLVTHAQCMSVLNMSDDDDDVDIVQGRNVYRAFSDVVDYGKLYQGVRRVVGRVGECAGRVQMEHRGETWLDVPLSDSFSQVGGLYINCMTDKPVTDMYIATGCEMSIRSPRLARVAKHDLPDSWHVLARHHRQAEKVYTSDVFVFDATNGMLTEVMIGITFARVAKASMSKMLSRLTTDESVLKTKPSQGQAALPKSTALIPNLAPHQAQVLNNTGADAPVAEKKSKKEKAKEDPAKSSRPDVTNDLRKLVAEISGVEPEAIQLDTEMADVGIDSLMGMEVAREVESVFKCSLDQTELMEATTLRKFVACLNHALYGPDGGDSSPSTEHSDDEDSSSSEGLSDITRATSPGIPNVKPAQAPAAKAPTVSAATPPAQTNLSLSSSGILKAFGAVKMLTDQEIKNFKLDRIHKLVLAGSNRLSTALVVEQFEKLGCRLRESQPGQVLERVPFQPQHGRLMKFIYDFLEWDTRLIDIDVFSGQITRTHIPVPRKTSDVIFAELMQAFPEFQVANRLTYYAGQRLADVLTGKTDGIRVIFGTLEGRDLVQDLYINHSFNRMQYSQMRDTIERLVSTLPKDQGPLKILEMGAGTGGTTYVLAPMLASLGFPVEYTFTDLSPSMVANARRKFGTEYPFMRFAVHDIEKTPVEELQGQHLVVSSNAVHATHNLVTSLTNVRKALRPDGFLMILEMTESAPFIDIIFGLLEGWWLFDDGRKHAIVPAEHWETELHAAGFGHVDWTDGSLPENRYQKVMIALASGTQSNRLPKPLPAVEAGPEERDVAAREAEANAFLAKHVAGWTAPSPAAGKGSKPALQDGKDAVVLVTGATGSLGSHAVAAFAEHEAVKGVVCVNRKSSTPVHERQDKAFTSRGIHLSGAAQKKLRILDTDTSKPQLGLPSAEYAWLIQNVTHIVHNAWPMSGTRPMKAFEPQFQSLRNLVDLARDVADHRASEPGFRVHFQLVSSIGVVGNAGTARIPEDRVPFAATLPIGYCEAKWVCERMLDETLHAHPHRFRAAVVRPGQIAGSRTSGFWNPVEHFAFLVKSAQTLRAWPALDGILQWVPVNDAAAVMRDLSRVDALHDALDAQPVYHIDNPLGQPWAQMNPVLADALGIPADRIVPFGDWVDLVRRSPLPAETDNPAARLIDFLDDNFRRMSCGGLILDTEKAKMDSEAMAGMGIVEPAVARKYVAQWKAMGFLHP